ncbi:MAG TPA: hypothetical protein VG106_10055 [Vicinamibacterales bacterium]|nr:hypothetical protein [Vicinamibacterales bacterium]
MTAPVASVMTGVRLINVSPEEMSDDDIRLALVRLSLDVDELRSDDEHAERVRRLAAAMNRWRPV